jgi:hypothetical protein
MQIDSRTARLAALGGFAVAAAVVVVYAAFVFLMHPIPVGGPNPITFIVACISVAVPCVALIAIHVAIGRQLRGAGK